MPSSLTSYNTGIDTERICSNISNNCMFMGFIHMPKLDFFTSQHNAKLSLGHGVLSNLWKFSRFKILQHICIKSSVNPANFMVLARVELKLLAVKVQ